MRILFLSPWFPFPPDNGIRIRLYHLLKTLARRHEVVLVSHVRQGDDAGSREIRELCAALDTVSWPDYAPARGRALLGLAAPEPRSLVDTYSPRMETLVRKWGQKQAWDVVVASTTDVGRYALYAPARAKVLEEHNFWTRVMHEQYARQTHWALRARYWLTWWKYRQYESRLYPHFDACTMVSETDAGAVRRMLPALPVHVVPNGADCEYYAGRAYTPERDTLVFNGSLTFSANLDAVQYLLADIWPQIRAGRPAARLKITGRADAGAAQTLPLDGTVQLTGYLDDIRPAIGNSWACLVPIRTGGGTRLKILEAMACGTPVVATGKGAEGLDVTPGENILLADRPADFAARTVELLNDAELRARLATNARRLVRAKYDWDTIGMRFEKLLCDLVQGAAA